MQNQQNLYRLLKKANRKFSLGLNISERIKDMSFSQTDLCVQRRAHRHRQESRAESSNINGIFSFFPLWMTVLCNLLCVSQTNTYSIFTAMWISRKSQSWVSSFCAQLYAPRLRNCVNLSFALSSETKRDKRSDPINPASWSDVTAQMAQVNIFLLKQQQVIEATVKNMV